MFKYDSRLFGELMIKSAIGETFVFGEVPINYKVLMPFLTFYHRVEFTNLLIRYVLVKNIVLWMSHGREENIKIYSCNSYSV